MWVFHYKQLWEQCASVKLYTQNAPHYEGDCEYRISSMIHKIASIIRWSTAAPLCWWITRSQSQHDCHKARLHSWRWRTLGAHYDRRNCFGNRFQPTDFLQLLRGQASRRICTVSCHTWVETRGWYRAALWNGIICRVLIGRTCHSGVRKVPSFRGYLLSVPCVMV